MTGVPDVVGPDLRVLFCGINPGLMSGELGRHFARPGNRFWKVLHAAGFTDRVLDPSEQDLLPALGLGITNIVDATTASAAELAAEDLRAGAVALTAKVAALGPSGLQARYQLPEMTALFADLRVVAWSGDTPSGAGPATPVG